MGDSIVHGTIPDGTEHDPVLLQFRSRESCTRCNGEPSADYGVGPEMPDGKIRYVHTAASSPAVTCFLSKDFGRHPVKMVVYYCIKKVVILINGKLVFFGRTQNFLELAFIHLVIGEQSLCETVAVGPVVNRNMIIPRQRAYSACLCRFLSNA